MRRQAWILLILVVVLSVALGSPGCLIGYDADGVELEQPSDTSPRIIVQTPEPDARIGDLLEVHLQVENLTLVPKWGQENVTGEGHLAVYVDEYPIVPDDEGVALSNFAIRVVGLAGSTEAEHTLTLVVRNNDRTPFAGLEPIRVNFIKLPGEGGGGGTGTGTGDGTGSGTN